MVQRSRLEIGKSRTRYARALPVFNTVSMQMPKLFGYLKRTRTASPKNQAFFANFALKILVGLFCRPPVLATLSTCLREAHRTRARRRRRVFQCHLAHKDLCGCTSPGRRRAACAANGSRWAPTGTSRKDRRYAKTCVCSPRISPSAFLQSNARRTDRGGMRERRHEFTCDDWFVKRNLPKHLVAVCIRRAFGARAKLWNVVFYEIAPVARLDVSAESHVVALAAGEIMIAQKHYLLRAWNEMPIAVERNFGASRLLRPAKTKRRQSCDE